MVKNIAKTEFTNKSTVEQGRSLSQNVNKRLHIGFYKIDEQGFKVPICLIKTLNGIPFPQESVEKLVPYLREINQRRSEGKSLDIFYSEFTDNLIRNYQKRKYRESQSHT